jgi:cation:H+ antiporter
VNLILLIIGLLILIKSSDVMVDAAAKIAEAAKVPPFIVGLIIGAIATSAPEIMIGVTIVALGTSLPELVSCLMAAYKKETDIAANDVDLRGVSFYQV